MRLEYARFMRQHNKVYAADKIGVRFQHYKKHRAWCDEHNMDKSHTYTVGVNFMSDLSEAEREKFIGQTDMEAVRKERAHLQDAHRTEPPRLSAYPTTVDWRTKGVVAAVKSIGGTPCCHIFGGTAMVETSRAIAAHKSAIAISEQQIFDCATYQCCNSAMGTSACCVDYIKVNGLCTTQQYPYTGRSMNKGNCASKISSCGTLTKASYDLTFIPPNRWDTDMMYWATRGMLLGCVYSGGASASYSRGILNNAKACDGPPNHSVNIVGYGRDSGSGLEYWIVRNNFGAQWGEAGHYRIQRGKDICYLESSCPGYLLDAINPNPVTFDVWDSSKTPEGGGTTPGGGGTTPGGGGTTPGGGGTTPGGGGTTPGGGGTTPGGGGTTPGGGGTTPGGGGSCTDSYDNTQCVLWAGRGCCSASYSKDTMATICKRSCGLCSVQMVRSTGEGQEDEQPGQPSGSSPQPQPAVDYSAELSSADETPCTDLNTNCAQWAALGHCQDGYSRPWMSHNCALSCGTCANHTANTKPGTTPASASSPRSTCHDYDISNCQVWAARGLCQSRADYMLVYCARSCSMCPDDPHNRIAQVLAEQAHARDQRDAERKNHYLLGAALLAVLLIGGGAVVYLLVQHKLRVHRLTLTTNAMVKATSSSSAAAQPQPVLSVPLSPARGAVSRLQASDPSSPFARPLSQSPWPARLPAATATAAAISSPAQPQPQSCQRISPTNSMSGSGSLALLGMGGRSPLLTAAAGAGGGGGGVVRSSVSSTGGLNFVLPAALPATVTLGTCPEHATTAEPQQQQQPARKLSSPSHSTVHATFLRPSPSAGSCATGKPSVSMVTCSDTSQLGPTRSMPRL